VLFPGQAADGIHAVPCILEMYGMVLKGRPYE
jgi:hypothetical protein